MSSNREESASIEIYDSQSELQTHKAKNTNKRGSQSKKRKSRLKSSSSASEQDQLKMEKESNEDQYVYESNARAKMEPEVETFEIKDMKRRTRAYHRNLVKESLQKMKIEGKSEFKREDSIELTEKLSLFPTDSFKTDKMTSNYELRDALIKHEAEIVSRLRESYAHIESSFVAKMVQSSKRSGSKAFITYKCGAEGCQAILKCLQTPEQFEVYLVRNSHNHTIQGKSLKQFIYVPPKPIEMIELDEQLHQIFGLHKGVFTQTRNMKYIEPHEKRILLRLQRQQKKKKSPTETLHPQIQRKVVPKAIPKEKTEKERSEIGSTYQAIREEFTQMLQEDDQVDAYLHSYPPHQFPCLLLASSDQMKQDSQLFPETVRLDVQPFPFRISRKKYPEGRWYIGIFSTLNLCLEPIILAFIVFNDLFNSDSISKALSSYSQLMNSSPSIFIMLRSVFNLVSDPQRYPIFLDVDETLSQVTPLLQNERNGRKFEQLIRTTDKQQAERLRRELGQKEQISSEELLLDHIISALPTFFFGFNLLRNNGAVRFIDFVKKRNENAFTLRDSIKCLVTLAAEFNRQVAIAPEGDLELELVHSDVALRQVRVSVGPKLLNIFYQQYCLAYELDITSEDQSQFHFGNVQTTLQSCSCLYQIYFGSPCRHLIRVARHLHMSYVSYFDRRYLIQ